MTVSESHKLLLDNIVRIEVNLKYILERLADLEDRVTENGG